MTARQDAIVHVQRDMQITIPGPVTKDEARRLVIQYLAGGELPEDASIVDMPPAIPVIRWVMVGSGL